MKLALKPENLAQLVFFIRDEKVMFDADLAKLYGVSTKALNQAFRQNISDRSIARSDWHTHDSSRLKQKSRRGPAAAGRPAAFRD
jgi:ORF6N domain